MSEQVLGAMLRKFERRAPLDQADRDALLALPYRLKTINPHGYITREGERPEQCCLLVAGFAYRQKLTFDGARQIVSVHIPGDLVDLEASLLRIADHNIQALTMCEVAMIAREDIERLILAHPKIGKAMWIDTLIDASIYREWVTNVGRRNARARISHLLCEFASRLEVAGLASEYRYELPMTQEQIADATGLTPVHVNRVLKALAAEGLIKRERRFVRITDWNALRDVGGFNELYLHLDQMAPKFAQSLHS